MHRLLLLTENYPPGRGGMAESCDRITRGLSGRGVVIDLVHFDRRAARPSVRRTAHGWLLRWPLEVNAAHTINVLWNRVRQTIDLDSITHVMAFGGVLPIAAAPLFGAMARRPLITLLRGSELDTGLFDPRRRPFLEDAIRRSAAVCAVTTDQAEKVSALFPQARLHVIPNGIDFELWQASPADFERAAKLREEFRSPRVIGFFGGLKAKKGIPFFLDVLRKSGLAVRFHLLFAGETDEELTAYLDAHPEVPATRVPPRDRFDLIPLYLACDFVALPSHYDGFPNVLIESAALGIPAIGAAVGGMRDLLEDGKNGFLFDPGDEHGCRRALTLAANADQAALASMRRLASQHVRLRCANAAETMAYLRVLDESAVVRALHAAE